VNPTGSTITVEVSISELYFTFQYSREFKSFTSSRKLSAASPPKQASCHDTVLTHLSPHDKLLAFYTDSKVQ